MFTVDNEIKRTLMFRKKSMIIDCIGFIISFLILAFAESFPLLILGKPWGPFFGGWEGGSF